MSDSIETLMTEVQKFVHSSGLVAYPHVLEFDIDSVPNVEWDGENWQQYLELAETINARIVYLGTTKFFKFSQDDDGSTGTRLAPDVGEREGLTGQFLDGADDDALRMLIDISHDGEASELRLAYVANGVVHFWITFASWYLEAIDLLSELREDRKGLIGEFRADHRKLNERAIREDWINHVAHDRRFYSAHAIPSIRQAAALQILTELSDLPPTNSGLVGLSWHVLNVARALLPQVKMELQDDVMSRLPEFVGNIRQSHPDWVTLRVNARLRIAKAYLVQEIGMNLPQVAEEVARYRE